MCIGYVEDVLCEWYVSYAGYFYHMYGLYGMHEKFIVIKPPRSRMRVYSSDFVYS